MKKGIIYDLEFKNKYTFIQGDSGTGKSRLVSLVQEYLTERSAGRATNISIDFSSSNIVVLSVSNIQFLNSMSDSIILVDEDMVLLLKSKLSELQSINSYFIIIYRELLNLPFGISDIKVMTSKRKDGITINYFENRYAFIEEKVNVDVILTEDSSSGFKFYKDTLIPMCVSSNGKSRVMKKIQELLSKSEEDILLVVIDEVGFGFEYNKIKESEKLLNIFKNVYFWCPLSFEYVLLNSGVFTDIEGILADPYSYWDISKYKTIEKYIESLLSKKLRSMFGIRYSKNLDVLGLFRDCVREIYQRNFDNYQDLLKDEFK